MSGPRGPAWTGYRREGMYQSGFVAELSKDLGSAAGRTRAAGNASRSCRSGVICRRHARRAMALEKAIDQEGQTEHRDKPADANPAVQLLAGDGNHEKQADTDAEQHDAGATVARGARRPLHAVVEIHGAIESS